jgi:hypothetical protein
MRHPYAAVAVVLVAVLVGGCTGTPFGQTGSSDGGAGTVGADTPSGTDGAAAVGGEGDDGTASSEGVDTTVAGSEDSTTDTGSVRTLTGEHPYVTDDRLDARALVRSHLDALGRSDSFTLTNNATVRYVSNDSVATRIRDIRRVGLASERLLIERFAASPDGTRQGESGQFANGTTTCNWYGDRRSCSDSGFDRQEALGLAVETTGLETVAGPAFAPDGTVERGGQTLYRYSATSLRPDVGESVRSELGPNATLRDATLLVAPSGRIVEYRFAVERGNGSGTRVLLERTYRTRAVNATTVASPSWLTDGATGS